ncbi:hypothetical protein [Okeania sp. SIO1I7]|uniref:hypothetical protein n=1 Tax=Okeania sp. SIO1I7 TaxID=2607772 RepID=UPI0013F7EF38|nr:hypothetical protein [Okeania sp. SIO1I7]NET27175.1 hypothetical protein [Okeania sp. SIO1I7]
MKYISIFVRFPTSTQPTNGKFFVGILSCVKVGNILSWVQGYCHPTYIAQGRGKNIEIHLYFC